MLRIALPNKGRLAPAVAELLEQAGLAPEMRGDRALQASLGADLLALFVGAKDIPELVADGAADVGITGRDLVDESGRQLEVALDLGLGRCRLAVASPEDGPLREVADVPCGAHVATSFPNLTKRYFRALGKEVALVPLSGAVEIAPRLGVADVIVDLVSTGSTLRVNGLRELGTVLESTALLVARPELRDDSDTSRQLDDLVTALDSVLRARGKRYLMANVPRRELPAMRRILPGITAPTVVDLLDDGFQRNGHVATHAVVDQAEIPRLIVELKRLGAEGILVTRIERLLP